jgi:hypothetical protein
MANYLGLPPEPGQWPIDTLDRLVSIERNKGRVALMLEIRRIMEPPRKEAARAYRAGILEGLRIAAKLPTEEEIGLALIEARSQKRLAADIWAAEVAHVHEMEAKYPEYITAFSLGCDALRQARAMLALFAIEARAKEVGLAKE